MTIFMKLTSPNNAHSKLAYQDIFFWHVCMISTNLLYLSIYFSHSSYSIIFKPTLLSNSTSLSLSLSHLFSYVVFFTNSISLVLTDKSIFVFNVYTLQRHVLTQNQFRFKSYEALELNISIHRYEPVGSRFINYSIMLTLFYISSFQFIYVL